MPAYVQLLRANLDHDTIGNEAPDLLDLLVGDRNAAPGPVGLQVGFPDRTLAVRQTVDQDVATGLDAQTAGVLAVGRVRVGDVEGAVELALRVPSVDAVEPLGSA